MRGHRQHRNIVASECCDVFDNNVERSSNPRRYSDIIETCKILSGKYDPAVVPFTNSAWTFKTRLQNVRFKYDLHKYCFTNPVVNI